MISGIQYDKLKEKKSLKSNDYSLSSSATSLKSQRGFNLPIEEYQLKLKLIDPLKLPWCKGKYFQFKY